MILAVKVEEMRPVFPVRRTLIAQPEAEFVNQTRRLQSVARRFPLEAAIGNAPEIRVDQRNQFLKGFRLAFLPLLKQPSDVARLWHRE
jgi:hypothetical protein